MTPGGESTASSATRFLKSAVNRRRRFVVIPVPPQGPGIHLSRLSEKPRPPQTSAPEARRGRGRRAVCPRENPVRTRRPYTARLAIRRSPPVCRRPPASGRTDAEETDDSLTTSTKPAPKTSGGRCAAFSCTTRSRSRTATSRRPAANASDTGRRPATQNAEKRRRLRRRPDRTP